MENDDQEKTEEPTSKRIEDARKKGQVVNSREVNNFLIFVFFAILIGSLIPALVSNNLSFLKYFIESPHEIRISDISSARKIYVQVLYEALDLFMIPLGLSIIFAVSASFIQNSFVISTESLMPKLEKISPLKGFKKLFSLRSIMEFIKGIFKISLIAATAYLIFQGEINNIVHIANLPLSDTIAFIGGLALKIIIACSVFVFLIAALDYSYQRYEYMKNLRMSRQELKEEFKQTEGNPEVKAKLRQIREQKARKRMMQKVPQADVVIRNPTHYAVALEYNSQEMDAPMVTALGQDNMALQIIKVAEENKVPVITNKPLAKALYETSELDQTIPLEHYKAVAEIIGYIYKMNGKQI